MPVEIPALDRHVEEAREKQGKARSAHARAAERLAELRSAGARTSLVEDAEREVAELRHREMVENQRLRELEQEALADATRELVQQRAYQGQVAAVTAAMSELVTALEALGKTHRRAREASVPLPLFADAVFSSQRTALGKLRAFVGAVGQDTASLPREIR